MDILRKEFLNLFRGQACLLPQGSNLDVPLSGCFFPAPFLLHQERFKVETVLKV
jgi:hypothetical protein